MHQLDIFSSTLAFQINPSGLNGRFGGAPSTIINVDRDASGVQLAANASPTKNLRLRLSAATISGKIGRARQAGMPFASRRIIP